MSLDGDNQESLYRPNDSDNSVSQEPFFGLERTALVFCSVFATMFLWNAGCMAWDLSRGAWPTTSAQIERVEELSGSKGAPSGRRVFYSYKVADNSYEAQTYFAPFLGPNGETYSSGQQAQVFYNSVFPGMSTLAPNSQYGLNIIYMILASVALAITLLGRPKASLGEDLTRELPNFLDCLAALIESGVSIPAAFEKAAYACSSSCPKLSGQVQQCIIKLKVNRIPLHETLAEIGIAYSAEQLNYLASTLAAAEQTSSSVAYQIKQQSYALRYHQKAEQLAAENAATNFGVRRDTSSRNWNVAPRRGPMGAEEILESLEPDRRKDPGADE